MRERSIILSDADALALAEGRKTQLRRAILSPAKSMQRARIPVIKHREPGDKWYGDHVWSMRNRMGVWVDYTDETFRALCPYGKPGDQLWVKEAFNIGRPLRNCEGIIDDEILWSGPLPKFDPRGRRLFDDWCVGYRADGDEGPWRPSGHMPRWASRFTLRINNIRIERLQEITPEDARAEGIEIPRCACETCHKTSAICTAAASEYVAGFRTLWDSREKPGTQWEDNPRVWVIEFTPCNK